VAEHGGELIDTGHLETRQLCHELGLTLDNLLQGETNRTEPLYFLDGRPYTYAEASEDFNAVYQKLHKDVSAASYPTTYQISTPRGRELDAMTIIEWIEESVRGGLASRFGQLLDVAYNIEFGAECSDQSALNLPARARAARRDRAVGRAGDGRLLGGESLDARLVLVLQARPVHVVRRRRGAGLGRLPLRRRAHHPRLPGLPAGRRGQRRADSVGGARRTEVGSVAAARRTEVERSSALLSR
jgi:hypothetical protein